jgi:tripartite-type tricarboxylate transporter receptor subunit TctC
VQWYGIVGPANLPPPIVKRLECRDREDARNPNLRELLLREALEPMPMTPEQFGRYMRDDIAHWRSSRRSATSKSPTSDNLHERDIVD